MGYPVLVDRSTTETEVQKSRFICDLAPVATTDTAQAFIDEIRTRYPDASHHCFAYVVGPPGSTARIGQSDDGEPHGTAGRPMLNVLLHADVGDVVAVVTRYFGGTKLGKGGLVRAYAGAVQAGLDGAPTADKVDWVQATIRGDYAFGDALRRVYPRFGAELVEETFEATLGHRVRVPRLQLASLTEAVTDATRGRATFLVDDDTTE